MGDLGDPPLGWYLKLGAQGPVGLCPSPVGSDAASGYEVGTGVMLESIQLVSWRADWLGTTPTSVTG